MLGGFANETIDACVANEESEPSSRTSRLRMTTKGAGIQSGGEMGTVLVGRGTVK